MIANELQARVTRAQIEKLERGLALFDDRPAAHPGVHPRLIEAQRAALASQIESLRGEISDYERLKEAGAPVSVQAVVNGMANIGPSLVRARVAASLTQRQLASRLGVHHQQIQRYEASDYQTASLARLMEIADVLKEALDMEDIMDNDDEQYPKIVFPETDRERDDRSARQVVDGLMKFVEDEGWLSRVTVRYGSDSQVIQLTVPCGGTLEYPIHLAESEFVFRAAELIDEIKMRIKHLAQVGLERDEFERYCKLNLDQLQAWGCQSPVG